MPKFFVTQEQIKDKKINIIGNDVKHIKNVLREKVGNNITICNTTNEKDYLCKISSIQNDKIECEILEQINNNTEPKTKITIFQGLPKSDKMELIIQKSVELGVNEITPIETKRCVVKLNDKDKEKKILRWQKISEVASKQCGRNQIPKINNIIKIEEISKISNNYDFILIAYENEEETTIKKELEKIKKSKQENLKIAIIIGPEGGLEKKEVENLQQIGAISITLGKRILRTETVAMNILSIILYELEN